MNGWCPRCGAQHESSACPCPGTATTGDHPYVYVESPANDNASFARLECIRELGYALVYMNYLHPWRLTDGSDMWGEQRPRVMGLCVKLGENQHEPDAGWWRAFLEEIRAEIENMC
jgi:hypothetical protein